MKYVVLLCDGMADLPIESLGNKTPMEAANKPNMDALAAHSTVGLGKTVADGLKPGSDVANLSVMGFDPAEVYTGRSPLEAASIGIDLADDDVAIRCNLVTLSDEDNYEDKTMIDYCAGDISTEEADAIMQTIQQELGGGEFDFYTGVSYRHCAIWHKGRAKGYTLTPPHDISGRIIGEHLGDHIANPELYELMKKSVGILRDHPVNRERIAKGIRPANSIWLWGQGTKTVLPRFEDKNGIKGAVISAVDLLKGIAKSADMQVIEVPGATGYIDTDFDGKAAAAVAALKDNDYVYIHIEAPDECGHRRETENKVRSIELIDEKVLSVVLKALEGTDFRIMILPDHPTPISTATHSSAPVPFMIYDSEKPVDGVEKFCEKSAAETGVFVPHGPSLINRLIK